jgi:formylglycine-generating enzyme required for sulfatase activity
LHFIGDRVKCLLRLMLIVTSIGLFGWLSGCDVTPEEPEYSNPFDPMNPITGGDPFQLEATVTEIGVQLQWQEVPFNELQGYRLYRGRTDSVNLTLLTDLGVNSSEYLDLDLQRSSVVWYRITARFPGGESSAQPVTALRVYTAPVVLIESDSMYVNHESVSLSIQAIRARWMWLSNYPDFSDGQWQPFASTISSWELPGSDGVKSVYLKISYDDSTLSPSIFDSIILDREASILWFSVELPESPLGLCDTISANMTTSDSVGIAWFEIQSSTGTPLYPPIYLNRIMPGRFSGGMEIRWGEDATGVQVVGHFQDLAGNIPEPRIWNETFDLALGMVEIPAGPFTMGINGADPEQGPEHQVYLDTYWLDRYLITNYQYAQFLSDGNSQYYYGLPFQLIEDLGGGQFRAVPGYEHLPVVMELWDEAQAYATWAGKRLPTEAEWEKAARGTDARLYPWGNDYPEPSQANYWYSGDPWEQISPNNPDTPCGFYNGRTYQGFHTIDSPGPYGNYDMAGNVWEWVSDWFDSTYYSVSPYQNPQGPDTGFVKVNRGGDCFSDRYFLRSHYRFFPADMQNRNANVGFRCASSCPP